MGHQLWRYSDDLFPDAEQVTLQPAGQVTAVFDRPSALRAEPGGPPHQPEMIFAGGADSGLAERLAVVIDRDDGVGALVGVDPECDHGPCSFLRRDGARVDRSAYPSQDASQAPLKPDRRTQRRPAGRKTDSSHEGNEQGGASPPDPVSLPLGRTV